MNRVLEVEISLLDSTLRPQCK